MFFVVELMTAVLCGVVLGIAEAMINSDPSECGNIIVWSSVSVAAISASLAALVTYFHPLGEKVGNGSLVLVSLLASASAACSAISNNDAATSSADGLAFAGGLVEAVLLVLGCASAFVGWLLSNASSREDEQSPLGRFDSAVDGAPTRHRAPSRKERHLDIPEMSVDENLLAPLHIHPSGVSDSSSREKVLAKLVRLAISAGKRKRNT
ncbi:membrane-associated protein, putative [Bodo saltans]|uniref:Membrane-associated protein, putative n=1 Tax=Bodo saltans TaxID=75058 RepID=A0A0S4JV19_BODSA|nr:membrane-associated protein, putative [Bodo saltans]|eukprot:CUG94408.1 membrane-associated protein, putative [Bodo saltans]